MHIIVSIYLKVLEISFNPNSIMLGQSTPTGATKPLCSTFLCPTRVLHSASLEHGLPVESNSLIQGVKMEAGLCKNVQHETHFVHSIFPQPDISQEHP